MKIRLEYETSKKEIVVMDKLPEVIEMTEAVYIAMNFFQFLKLGNYLNRAEMDLQIRGSCSRYSCDDWTGYIFKLS